MINNIKSSAEKKMAKCMDFIKYNLNKINTGRISTNLVNDIKIKYYDKYVLLKNIASIVVENSLTLKVSLFELEYIKLTEKAILKSNLGLTIKVIGQKMYLSIPNLSQERRKELIKIIKYELEQGKINIRNIRREFNEKIKKLLKKKIINLDEEYRTQDFIQKLTDSYIKNIENIYLLKVLEIKKN